MATKTVVIGLDGSSWDLIGPWIEQGRLPNLHRFISNGVQGRLKSSFPPVTCPAWKCYSTGKNPANLGVFWWVGVDWKNRRMPLMHRSTSFQSREVWDILNDYGISTGIINMPTTYPPKPVDGFMVSGWESPEGATFTWPPELGQALIKKYKYQTKPQPLLYHDKEATLNKIIQLMESRFRLARDVMEEGRVDFLHVTLFYINTLHHFYWDDDVVYRAWQFLDKEIGNLVSDQINTVIISDHGGMKISASFYINSWLREKGYLQVRRHSAGLLAKAGLHQERLKRWAVRLKLMGLRRLIPRSLKRIVPQCDKSISGRDLENLIDWDHSRVMGTGQGPVYIDRDKISTDYEQFRQLLIDELGEIRDPLQGRKVFNRIWKKEEIFTGKFNTSAPDLFLEFNKHFHVAGGLKEGSAFDYENSGWQAENDYYGICIAHGPAFAVGKTIEGARIIDITPTLLDLYGIPVPDDIDGRPLKSVFKEGKSSRRQRAKSRQNTPADEFNRCEKVVDAVDEEDVKSRLQALGYLE
ncbi:MAG: alkaline phosphatase family protein [Sedimentisphaerales bacterium]|nr:alkaline phosphatase family protein [Sedimentisphaerales bacterium]